MRTLNYVEQCPFCKKPMVLKTDEETRTLTGCKPAHVGAYVCEDFPACSCHVIAIEQLIRLPEDVTYPDMITNTLQDGTVVHYKKFAFPCGVPANDRLRASHKEVSYYFGLLLHYGIFPDKHSLNRWFSTKMHTNFFETGPSFLFPWRCVEALRYLLAELFSHVEELPSDDPFTLYHGGILVPSDEECMFFIRNLKEWGKCV